MSAEDDLSSIMNRLEARLDAMEKGEMPPQLREHMEGKKDSDEKESKDDKKTNVGISYIDVANTHILEQLIRMAFKKPGLRRLSELLQ